MLLGDDQTFEGVPEGGLAAGRFLEAMDFEISWLLSSPRMVMPLGLPEVEGLADAVAESESLRVGDAADVPVSFLGVSRGRDPVAVEDDDDGEAFPWADNLEADELLDPGNGGMVRRPV